MDARLSDDERRLRGLTPGDIADQVGELRARSADLEVELGKLKDEAIRRGLGEAEGALFRMTLSPAGTKEQFDLAALRAAKGDKFVLGYMKTVPVGPILRSSARKRAG